ncbi:hypothetical protein NKH33_26265 [Mesorhizobium sp. M1182]|uniref:hypothetical protein n=1 Tax=unclassified Mesorhizobium TaxID=325217 RepID=UPI003334D962
MSVHRGTGLLQHRSLNFADDFVAADFFENGAGLHVESSIVVNLSSDRLIIDDAIKTSIAPWRSAMLSKATIEQSGRIAVLKVCKTVDLGGVMFRGWDWLGNRIRSFPRQTPLFISPQDTIGEVELDPLFFSGEIAVERQLQRFVLKLTSGGHPLEPTGSFTTTLPSSRSTRRYWEPAACRNSGRKTRQRFIEMSPWCRALPMRRFAGSAERTSGNIRGIAISPTPTRFGWLSNCTRSAELIVMVSDCGQFLPWARIVQSMVENVQPHQIVH